MSSLLLLLLLLLLPLSLQPIVGIGLSNNVLPFFPICHQLSPSSHSQHLNISFYFIFPTFLGSTPSSRPFQFLSEDLFWAPYPPPFSLGDLTDLSLLSSSLHPYIILIKRSLYYYYYYYTICMSPVTGISFRYFS